MQVVHDAERWTIRMRRAHHVRLAVVIAGPRERGLEGVGDEATIHESRAERKT